MYTLPKMAKIIYDNYIKNKEVQEKSLTINNLI